MSIDKSQEIDEEELEIIDNKFLTFNIGQEFYGVGIENVMEIIEMIKITPMPESRQYVEGVINLRGKVIPVMNVRKRFSMAHKEWDDRTCIIVVKVREVEIGLIVDTVAEVIDIPQEQIQPPPEVQQRKEQRFIMGMGKVETEVNILLDLEKLLFDENEKSIVD